MSRPDGRKHDPLLRMCSNEMLHPFDDAVHQQSNVSPLFFGKFQGQWNKLRFYMMGASRIPTKTSNQSRSRSLCEQGRTDGQASCGTKEKLFDAFPHHGTVGCNQDDLIAPQGREEGSNGSTASQRDEIDAVATTQFEHQIEHPLVFEVLNRDRHGVALESQPMSQVFER